MHKNIHSTDGRKNRKSDLITGCSSFGSNNLKLTLSLSLAVSFALSDLRSVKKEFWMCGVNSSLEVIP